MIVARNMWIAMATNDPTLVVRRMEAQSLIALARAMLTNPAEEIAVIFLDHAIDALQSIEAGDSSEVPPPN